MTALPEEAVKAALDHYSEGGCMGLNARERREVTKDMLEAAAPYMSGVSARELALEEVKLERSIERWRGMKPSEVMKGSTAQITYALEDARKDILSLARALSSPDHADAGKVEGDGSAAARDVLAERRRQIEVEGFTPEHDDQHEGGELAFAAASYVIGVSTLTGAVCKGKLSFPWAYRIWPRAWDLKWWKPSDRRRDLVKAGAFIIAEIERLDRLSAPASEGA